LKIIFRSRRCGLPWCSRPCRNLRANRHLGLAKMFYFGGFLTPRKRHGHPMWMIDPTGRAARSPTTRCPRGPTPADARYPSSRRAAIQCEVAPSAEALNGRHRCHQRKRCTDRRARYMAHVGSLAVTRELEPARATPDLHREWTLTYLKSQGLRQFGSTRCRHDGGWTEPARRSARNGQ
jgi:hypothetical protein